MTSDDDPGPTVLLVERDENFRRPLEEFLASRGLVVRTEWDAKRAAALLKGRRYDIVLAGDGAGSEPLSGALRNAMARGTRAILMVDFGAGDNPILGKFGPSAYFLRTTTERSILDELADILVLALNPPVTEQDISEMMGVGPDSPEEIDFASMSPEVRMKLERLVLIRRKGREHYGDGNTEAERAIGREGFGDEETP